MATLDGQKYVKTNTVRYVISEHLVLSNDG